MARVCFDITDIVHFAGRSNRLTGIQRVEFNLINLLVAKHGGRDVRCIFWHPSDKAYYEFDPSAYAQDAEFDAEQLLLRLGVTPPPGRIPSRVHIKSYLRAHARNKLQRVLLKAKIFILAWLSPDSLNDMGLSPRSSQAAAAPISKQKIAALSADDRLVHLGSSWFFPQTWQFAARHKQSGGAVFQYIHDLIPVTHPQFMTAKEPSMFIEWLQQALAYATHFPCNSLWTESDLQRFAAGHDRPCRSYVVPLAHEFIGFARDSNPEMPERMASLATRRFVLCVGTIEARKNGLVLLKVWQQLCKQLGEQVPVLVFAGRYGRIGGAEFRDYLEATNELAGHVQIVDGPSDQAMAWLYRNCLFSTYPSHVEGWGLPVGESAWFGRYCVASQASSIPEVCGDLAGYVDPTDMKSIKAGILKPILDPAFLQERERAIAAAQLRTWQDVADDLYASLVNG
ncbi:MAG: glycosyltransferase family 1 protein [Steroidobacteraceae bacterium]